jgi:hypothetical protein
MMFRMWLELSKEAQVQGVGQEMEESQAGVHSCFKELEDELDEEGESQCLIVYFLLPHSLQIKATLLQLFTQTREH